MNLTILEAQPSFPEVDLSQNNAAFLEMFLQNKSLVEASHPSAEASQLLYSMAHWAVEQSKDSFNNPDTHASFTHGFTMYEVVSTLVAPTPIVAREQSIFTATRDLVNALRGAQMDELLSDAYSEFIQSQPRTAEIIVAAAKRYHAGLTQYALMGAAVERQLELETREYDKNIVQ
jgi:hypothetical protein